MQLLCMYDRELYDPLILESVVRRYYLEQRSPIYLQRVSVILAVGGVALTSSIINILGLRISARAIAIRSRNGYLVVL